MLARWVCLCSIPMTQSLPWPPHAPHMPHTCPHIPALQRPYKPTIHAPIYLPCIYLPPCMHAPIYLPCSDHKPVHGLFNVRIEPNIPEPPEVRALRPMCPMPHVPHAPCGPCVHAAHARSSCTQLMHAAHARSSCPVWLSPVWRPGCELDPHPSPSASPLLSLLLSTASSRDPASSSVMNPALVSNLTLTNPNQAEVRSEAAPDLWITSLSAVNIERLGLGADGHHEPWGRCTMLPMTSRPSLHFRPDDITAPTAPWSR